MNLLGSNFRCDVLVQFTFVQKAFSNKASSSHKRHKCYRHLSLVSGDSRVDRNLVTTREGASNQMLGGAESDGLASINNPSFGKYCDLQFLPATPSSQFRNLEGPFELTLRPLMAPRLVHCYRNYRDARTG